MGARPAPAGGAVGPQAGRGCGASEGQAGRPVHVSGRGGLQPWMSRGLRSPCSVLSAGTSEGAEGSGPRGVQGWEGEMAWDRWPVVAKDWL